MRLPGLRGLAALDVARRVGREIVADDCAGQAAQLAYYFLFSLFPLLLFLVTLIGYLPIPDLFDRIMAWMGEVLPSEALALVRDNVESVATSQRGGLLSLGAIIALWSASAGFRAIMSALNRAYGVEEGRPYWKYYGISLLMTIALSVFVITAFALLVFGPQLGRWLAGFIGLGGAFDTAWNIARWPVALALLVLVLAVVYYVAPDVEQSWKWITPGSAVAVVGWVVASLAFSFYVQNFGSYDQTYGSLGAVIVLLLWLYLSGFALLVGGEVNAVIEHLASEGKPPGAKRLAERSGPVRREGTTGGPRAAVDRREAGERRHGGDRRLLSVVPTARAGVQEPAAPAARPGPERRRGERRRGERRRGERRGHLTLVHPAAPERPAPEGGEAGDGGPDREPPMRGAAAPGPRPAFGVVTAEARAVVPGLPSRTPRELLEELGRAARRLAALQVRLAVVELRAALRRLAAGLGFAAGSLVIAFVAGLFFAGGLLGLLAAWLPVWLAALLVATAALAAGGVAIRLGLRRAQSALGAPRRLPGTVAAEARWLRGLLRR